MDLLHPFKKENETDNNKASAVPTRLKKNKRVLILTADDTHDLEFFYPYYRLSEEGYDVDVATIEGGAFKGKFGLGLNDTLKVTDLAASNYELLYIPGGKAPSRLRDDKDVIAFVKQFAETGKPIAAICHGPQVLISAGLVSGTQMTAWPEVKGELEKAGATFIDEALVEDGQFITARKPGDLSRHVFGAIDYLNNPEKARQSRGDRKAS